MDCGSSVDFKHSNLRSCTSYLRKIKYLYLSNIAVYFMRTNEKMDTYYIYNLTKYRTYHIRIKKEDYLYNIYIVHIHYEAI